MPIPSGFYYSETISTEQYSSNPQGMPNFIRMAQLKSDYWPKNFPASVPKPKTLIFADWTARAWDQDKINAVVKKFAELTKAGFKLYLWQKGAIKLLSDPMVLKDYDVRVNIMPAFQDEISQAMEEHKLTYDKTLVIDDYQLDLLFGKNPESPRTIDAAVLFGKVDSLPKKDDAAWIKITDAMKRASPPITAVVFSKLYSKTEDIKKWLEESNLNLPIVEKYQAIEWCDDYSSDFIINAMTNIVVEEIKSISLVGNKIYSILNQSISEKGAVLHLKLLVLEKVDLDLRSLFTIVASCQELILDKCTLSLNLSHEPYPLQFLEKITLRSVRAPHESFKTLFNSMRNLKSLSVEKTPLPQGLTEHLVSIEKIVCLKQPTDILSDLLNATPDVKSLAFDITPENSLLVIEKNLSLLEDLLITSGVRSESNVAAAIITDLLNYTPNLRKMHLTGGGSLLLTERSLPFLKDFTFMGKVTNTDLCHLVAAASNIEILVFSNQPFVDRLTLPANSLPFLNNLHLANQTLDQDFINLLEAAPNLHTLSHPEILTPISAKLQNLFDRIPEPLARSASPNISTHNLKSTQPSKIPRDHRVDTDTTLNPNKTFHSKEIFYPMNGGAVPQVASYRLQVFENAGFEANVCRIDSKSSQVFEHPKKTPKLHTKDVYQLGKPNCIYGKQEFQLTQRFQPIASLSPTEIMTDYHVTPATASVEIAYSSQDNLYYICSKGTTNQTVTIDFLLSCPIQPRLDDHVEAIANEFRAFKPGELVLNENPTEDDFVNAIREQKVGACRHRAVAFKLFMKRELPNVPVRIVENDCHMFVEVKQGSRWLNCDLGGYPAKLDIDRSNAPIAIPIPTITQQPIPYATQQQCTYQRYFETWETTLNARPSELLPYIQKLLNGIDKKQLIQMNSSQQRAFTLAIQGQAKACSRPVFYIHDPDDLVCSAPFVTREGDIGRLCQEPSGGGALHDFLTQHDNAVLIVNYSNFSAEDIVRFNGLLDKERHADGTPLPEQAIVIGIIDPAKSTSYRGADFYSRFDVVLSAPQVIIPQLTPVLTVCSTEIVQDEVVSIINLCHSSTWLTQLMGSWILKEGLLYFQAGELVEKLRLNQPIVIQNPPTDEAFELFWQQARLFGHIRHEGQDIPLQPDQALYCCEGYRWDEVLKQVVWSTSPSVDAYILNPTTLNRLINDYQIQDHQFNKKPGILSQHADKPVFSIYVTRTLSEDEWGLFFKESQKYPSLHLLIACAPGVTLPQAFNDPIPASVLPISQELRLPITQSTACIDSNDADLTIAILTENNDDWLIFDISECTAHDLLIRISGEMHGFESRFTETQQALLVALNENKKVILTGDFSDELLDGLTTFFIKRKQDAIALGQVVLVTQNQNPVIETHQHRATPEEKQRLLCIKGFTQADIDTLEAHDPTCMTTQPFISLLARLDHQKKHPEESSNQAWYGLETLPSNITLKDFDPSTSEDEAAVFLDERCSTVANALATKPYVFLAGLTGVGKSRFVEQAYQTTETRQLYRGENTQTMVDWAQGINGSLALAADVEKILFIDEANLSTRQWSEFEGLFNTPPGILIAGQYFPLTPQHKVIFAGNPLSYGDERTLSNLFKRRPNTVVFNPLSMAFIYEKIINPVFEHTTLSAAQVEAVASELLRVYQVIISFSTDEVLISPREIQMMAILVNNYSRNHPDMSADELITVVKFYATSMSAALVPAKNKTQFDAACPPVPFLYSPVTKLAREERREFLQTESRKPVIQALNDYLTIRAHRQSDLELNSAQKYGGLGGLILEGEPGIGKSKLVVDYLVSQGFNKGNVTVPNQGDVFYQIFVSMSLEAKKKCLLKAFDEGAVVILDEINSAPMMEQLLNGLLMGQTPKGEPPKVPGFTVIGTQNPATMAGRRMASTALARRMQTCYMPPYTKEEMIAILQHKGLSTQESRDLVDAFIMKCEQAKREHRTPAPVFRNLMNTADNVLKGQPHTPNYDFLMKVLAHPATKVLSVILFLAGVTLLGVATAGLGYVVPLAIGLASLTAGLGLFASTRVASQVLDGDELVNKRDGSFVGK